MSESDEVLYDVDDHGVLVLTLNRPERRNMWSLGMETAFYGGLARGAQDPDVRVIVVTGAGNTFCPGLDPNVLDEIRAALGTPPTGCRRPSPPPSPNWSSARSTAPARVSVLPRRCAWITDSLPAEPNSPPPFPNADCPPRMRRHGCWAGSPDPPTPWI